MKKVQKHLLDVLIYNSRKKIHHPLSYLMENEEAQVHLRKNSRVER